MSLGVQTMHKHLRIFPLFIVVILLLTQSGNLANAAPLAQYGGEDWVVDSVNKSSCLEFQFYFNATTSGLHINSNYIAWVVVADGPSAATATRYWMTWTLPTTARNPGGAG